MPASELLPPNEPTPEDIQIQKPTHVPNEIRVESGSEEGFRQLPQVEFEHVGNDIGVNVSQIHQIGAILKRLTQFLHFGFDARYSVQTLNTKQFKL